METLIVPRRGSAVVMEGAEEGRLPLQEWLQGLILIAQSSLVSASLIHRLATSMKRNFT
jgi:hypothetical protein